MTVLEQLKTDGTSSESADMDSATIFHHCVVLLFGAVNQTMLHCTGRLIPQIVKQLKPHLSADNYKLISTCQGSSFQTQLVSYTYHHFPHGYCSMLIERAPTGKERKGPT